MFPETNLEMTSKLGDCPEWLDLMDHLFLVGIGTASTLVLGGSLFTWLKISNYLKAKRTKQLIELRAYEERLKVVVSELLAQVNDIDQSTKYIGATPDPEWSRRLQGACSQLVTIGNALPTIESLLKEEKVKDGREFILDTCRSAAQVSEELKQLRRVEPRLTDREKK